jgi:hypothetical protein
VTSGNGEWESREGGTSWIFRRWGSTAETNHIRRLGYVYHRGHDLAEPSVSAKWHARTSFKAESFDDLDEAKAWIECVVAVLYAKELADLAKLMEQKP